MNEYTFVVEKPCPICGESTRVVKLKSRLIAEKTDEDFCVRYKGVNPYFYQIWFCEHCGFAADEKHFLAPMPARYKEMIRVFLEKKQLHMEFVAERGVPDAVASYRLAILFAEMTKQGLAHQAGLHLHLAWVYRAADDRDHEHEEMRRASALYEEAFLKERFPQEAMTDNMVVYLIGAIAYRLGDREKATLYLSRIMGDQNLHATDPKVYERARGLWQEIREEKDGK